MALQRNLFQKKLKTIESNLALDFNEQDQNIHNQTPPISTPPILPPSDLPVWSDYFDHNDIYCDENGYYFQTYYKQPILTNSLDTPIIFIAHHGAGSNALTFAELSTKISTNSSTFNSTPGFFTFDMRGHGNTNLINKSNNYDLNINQLISDFNFIIGNFFNLLLAHNFQNCNIYLIGHSLGGSVLTKFSTTANLSHYIKGLIILDIVEETAINALPHMSNYLLNLPSSFTSIDNAIQYYNNNEIVNNLKSCKISIPGLITKSKSNDNYIYIINLLKTQPFWNNWFLGMSNDFINISNNISKLLILSNNDYLDKSLIIGQMQGKYQLIVFHSNHFPHPLKSSSNVNNQDSDKIGHFIHEDIPNKLSISLLEFVERNNSLNFFKKNHNDNEYYKKLNLINKLNKKWNVGNTNK